jgi:RNA polymerase sigma factor (sigma-70 family)
MFTMNALDEWFVAEILAHEAALMRFLSQMWGNACDLPDLRQEIYLRVYEAAAKRRPDSPKAFLFATGRNLMFDRWRRKRVVSIDYAQDLESLGVLVDEVSPEDQLSARQELRRLAEALDELSDNCRAVIWLRRVEGLSQREAAQRLGMHEGALEGYLSRGMRALTKAVYGHSPENSSPDSDRVSEHEGKRGQRGD